MADLRGGPELAWLGRMRTVLLLPVLVSVALGACSQSLTHGMSGAGGTATGGTGATGGGFATGTGGAGGLAGSLCAGLATQYLSAVAAQQACTGGALTDQCQQVVPSALSVCGACPTYVNDATQPSALQQAWELAGCNKTDPAVPCFDGACPPAYGGTCLIAGQTNHGTCVAVTTPGTGGSSPDGGGSPCAGLSQKYAALLPLVKSCTPGAANQCAQLVPTELAVCSAGCTTYVNDATELNGLRQQWTAAGCSSGTVSCPAIRCQQTLAGGCATADSGGAFCIVTDYAPL
jgi:hypothetical protein